MSSAHDRLMTLFDALCDAPSAQQLAELARLRAAGDPVADPLAAMLQADEAPSPLDQEAQVALAPDAPAMPARYRTLGLIGQGGMGRVFRVFDTVLNRAVALKVVELAVPELIERFLSEAQVVAQLQHPGIVPVHDLGQLPNGRPYFTMQEVLGDTWAHALEPWSAEAAKRRDAVYVLRQVAQAVGYAHKQGVIHRDLKPANVMVGQHGEVVVLDWGLARPLAETQLRALEDRRPTEAGQIMGTPGYMAPEQAFGDVARISKPTDVYALGAMLYWILCGEIPRILNGPAPLDPGLPEPLTTLCMAALSDDPTQRPPDADAVAEALSAWLSGTADRAWAEQALTAAAADRDAAERARVDAAAKQAELAQQRAMLPVGAPIEAKAPVWALEDEVDGLRRRAQTLEARWLRQVHSALSRAPDLAEAHGALAGYHRAAAEAAESQGDDEAAQVHREAVAAHDRGRHAGWLAGRTRLSVHTVPPGAHATLWRWGIEGRWRTPCDPVELGTTPLQLSVPSGAALLVLQPPTQAAVRVPLRLGRGGSTAVQVPLGAAPPDGTCYVPAGPFQAGGDPDAPDSFPPSAVRVPGFLIATQPVTNRDFIQFLDALVAAGQAEQALALAPREPVGGATGMVYGRTAAGGFTVGADAEGVAWDLDQPVVQITWHAAMAYCRWWAQVDGLPWRLPHELEWEKAARGADGRRWPWGDRFDPALARSLGSVPGPPRRATVDAHPTDASPYGVRGLGGNVRDWCLNVWQPDAPPSAVLPRPPEVGDDRMRATRGGSYVSLAPMCRAATRFAAPPEQRFGSVGFRVACDWPPRATVSRWR